jgi:hypothetical protein
MKRILLVLLVGCLAILAMPAAAGKIEDIIAAVKKECGRDMTKEEAVRGVKSVYVTCTPGGMAELEGGCRIKCLKQSGGGVLGE